MVIRNDDLTLINRDGERVVEPGEFRFWAGGSLATLKLSETIELQGPDGERGPTSRPTTTPIKTGADE